MNKKKDENTRSVRFDDKMMENPIVFINMLKARGIIGNEKIEDAQIRAAQQKRKKIAFHNTLMLLRNYRQIAWMVECFPDTIASELDESFKDIDRLIEKVDIAMSLESKKLESRFESVKKTRIMLDRINEALTVLKKKPGNGERLYKIIYTTYIQPEVISIEELASEMFLSDRQFYRLRDQAVKIISLRLWSAPTSKSDFWLDILTALENVN